MVAGPVACLLHDVLGDRRTHFTIEQGRFMSPPSASRILVDLEIERGRITGLVAGGEARRARTFEIVVPCDASPVQTASGQQSQ